MDTFNLEPGIFIRAAVSENTLQVRQEPTAFEMGAGWIQVPGILAT